MKASNTLESGSSNNTPEKVAGVLGAVYLGIPALVEGGLISGVAGGFAGAIIGVLGVKAFKAILHA